MKILKVLFVSILIAFTLFYNGMKKVSSASISTTSLEQSLENIQNSVKNSIQQEIDKQVKQVADNVKTSLLNQLRAAETKLVDAGVSFMNQALFWVKDFAWNTWIQFLYIIQAFREWLLLFIHNL